MCRGAHTANRLRSKCVMWPTCIKDLEVVYFILIVGPTLDCPKVGPYSIEDLIYLLNKDFFLLDCITLA